MLTRERLSIAIPNFNYGQYLGRAIESVLAQDDPDVEVVICDNQSTDDSVDVARSFNDERVHLFVNPVNVGFANNLDRAVARTTGDRVILLSSDDVMHPGALAAYRLALSAKDNSSGSVVASRFVTIDETETALSTWDWPTWLLECVIGEGAIETAHLRSDFHDINPLLLLRKSLLSLRNPLPFATVCYPRSLWERTGGYLGSRQFNPDKWFNWRLLAEADGLITIDAPLFSYRVHSAGQTREMRASGALKQLIDQYAYTYDVPDSMLHATGLVRSDLEHAFVLHDCSARSLALLEAGDIRDARRYCNFARATYPSIAVRTPLWLVARVLSTVPGGAQVLRIASRASRFGLIAAMLRLLTRQPRRDG